MTDRVAQGQATAAKWKESVEKLRGEVARRQATGRETKALARAKVSLARAERLAADAAARVEEMDHKALAAAAKVGRQAAATTALERRLDKIAEAAPKVMKRWTKDRKNEPKRIEKRKKALDLRTTKDLRSGGNAKEFFGIRRRRRGQALTELVEAATFPTGPIIPYVPPQAKFPDRPGLLPGDFRLIDPALEAAEDWSPPKQWTADYVGRRMADAHAVLRRLPMVTRPKEFGANWPEYIHEGVELAYQAGAGTLLKGRNRIMGGISADDIARMNEALAWPLTYLIELPLAARALNEWAYAEATEAGSTAMEAAVFEATQFIANQLNKKKVTVT